MMEGRSAIETGGPGVGFREAARVSCQAHET